MSYTLVTQHGPERKVRRKRFADFDSAKAFADANTPDTDPSMIPTLDDAIVAPLTVSRNGKPERYEQGQFWFGNRYGVIYKGAAK